MIKPECMWSGRQKPTHDLEILIYLTHPFVGTLLGRGILCDPRRVYSHIHEDFFTFTPRLMNSFPGRHWDRNRDTNEGNDLANAGFAVVGTFSPHPFRLSDVGSESPLCRK